MKVSKFPSICPKLAEEVGWHIGDGSMGYYNKKGYLTGIYQLRGHIEDDKPHYIQRIKPIFRFLYDIDISLREMPSTRVFGFQIWSNDLVKFKEKLGLKLGPKLEVKIPEIFLTNKELKIAVVRGIFDTDGCVYLERKYGKLYPRMQITTISSPLSQQLLKIFRELGFKTICYSYIPKEKNKKETHIIIIRGIEMLHKFMEIIKPANPKFIKKYQFFKENFK